MTKTHAIYLGELGEHISNLEEAKAEIQEKIDDLEKENGKLLNRIGNLEDAR